MAELRIGPSEVLELGSYRTGPARTQFLLSDDLETPEVTGVFISNPRCGNCGSFVYDEKFYPIFLAHEDMHVALVETGEPAASLSYDSVDRGMESLHICGRETTITRLKGPID